jgi:hypothetical protein
MFSNVVGLSPQNQTVTYETVTTNSDGAISSVTQGTGQFPMDKNTRYTICLVSKYFQTVYCNEYIARIPII